MTGRAQRMTSTAAPSTVMTARARTRTAHVRAAASVRRIRPGFAVIRYGCMAGSDLGVQKVLEGAVEENAGAGIACFAAQRLGEEGGGGAQYLAVVLVGLLEAAGELVGGVVECGDEVVGGEGGDVVLVEEVVERVRVRGDDLFEREGLGGGHGSPSWGWGAGAGLVGSAGPRRGGGGSAAGAGPRSRRPWTGAPSRWSGRRRACPPPRAGCRARSRRRPSGRAPVRTSCASAWRVLSGASLR